MNTIDTYIINLKDSVARREHITKEIKKSKLINPIFVDAVDGRSIKNIETKFDLVKVANRIGRNVTEAEAGCTMSHQKCYDLISSVGGGWAIVLEDDILLKREFDLVLDVLTGSVSLDRPVIILLNGIYWYTKRKGLNAVNQSNLYDKVGVIDSKYLVKIYDAYYTCSYLINDKAAKLMLEDKPSFLADDWRYIRKKGIDVYGLIPPITVIEKNFDSTIKSIDDNKLVLRSAAIKRMMRSMPNRVLKLIGHYYYA